MSFGRDMASGVGGQIVNLIIIAFVLGGALVAALMFVVPWLWEHVSIAVK